MWTTKQNPTVLVLQWWSASTVECSRASYGSTLRGKILWDVDVNRWGQAGIYKFDKERMEQNEGRCLAAAWTCQELQSFQERERERHRKIERQWKTSCGSSSVAISASHSRTGSYRRWSQRQASLPKLLKFLLHSFCNAAQRTFQLQRMWLL